MPTVNLSRLKPTSFRSHERPRWHAVLWQEVGWRVHPVELLLVAIAGMHLDGCGRHHRQAIRTHTL
jgi:hypothetical protein